MRDIYHLTWLYSNQRAIAAVMVPDRFKARANIQSHTNLTTGRCHDRQGVDTLD